MEDIGVRDNVRPTVGQMMTRDFSFYLVVGTPILILLLLFILPSMVEPEEGAEPMDMTYFYAVLVADIGFGIAVLYSRWSTYSSVLNSGVEVPGEVSRITRSGDAVTVEYAYRWQAETIRSTKAIRGFIPKRRIKEEVGLRVTLLVDPSKPKRYLVLDTVR